MTTARHGADCFDIISFVGGSEDAKVYHVRHKDTGEPLTMHVVPKQKEPVSQHLDSSLVVEAFRIPYAVSLRYTFETKSRHYAVLDDIKEERKLYKFFQAHGPFEPADVTFIIAEILVSISELHAYYTTYQRLSLNTIFFDVTGHVKLRRDLFEVVYWVQNECFRCRQSGICNYHEQAAVGREAFAKDWSDLGILLCLLLTGRKPKRLDESHIEARAGLPSNLPKTAVGLIKVLLNWRKAPFTASQIQEHEFFSDVDWQKAKNRGLISPEIFIRAPPRSSLKSSLASPTISRESFFKGEERASQTIFECSYNGDQPFNGFTRNILGHQGNKENRVQYSLDSRQNNFQQRQPVDGNNNALKRTSEFDETTLTECNHFPVDRDLNFNSYLVHEGTSVDNVEISDTRSRNSFDSRHGKQFISDNVKDLPDNVTFVTAESLDRAFEEQRHQSKEKQASDCEAEYSAAMSGSPLSDSLKPNRYYQNVYSPTYQQQQAIPTFNSLYNSFPDNYSAGKLRNPPNPASYGLAFHEQVRKRDEQSYNFDKQHASNFQFDKSFQGRNDLATSFATSSPSDMPVTSHSKGTPNFPSFTRSRSYHGSFTDSDRLDYSVPLAASLNVASPVERANELLKSTFGDWRVNTSEDPSLRRYSEGSTKAYLSKNSLVMDNDTVKPPSGKDCTTEPLHKRLSRSLMNMDTHFKNDNYSAPSTNLTTNSLLRRQGESEDSGLYSQAPCCEGEDERFVRDFLTQSLPIEYNYERDDDILKSTWPVGPSLINTNRPRPVVVDVAKRSSSLMQKISDHGALQRIREGAYLQRKRDFSLPIKQPLTSSKSNGIETVVRKSGSLNDMRNSKSFDDRYLSIDEEARNMSLQSLYNNGLPRSVWGEEENTVTVKPRGSDSSIESPIEVQKSWHDRQDVIVDKTPFNNSSITESEGVDTARSNHKRTRRGRSRKSHEKLVSGKVETVNEKRKDSRLSMENVEEEIIATDAVENEVFLENNDCESELVSKNSFEVESKHVEKVSSDSVMMKHDVDKAAVSTNRKAACGYAKNDGKPDDDEELRGTKVRNDIVNETGKLREDNHDDKIRRRKLRKMADVKKAKKIDQESKQVPQSHELRSVEHSKENVAVREKEHITKSHDEASKAATEVKEICEEETLNDEGKDEKRKQKKSTRSVSFYDNGKNHEIPGKSSISRKSKSTGTLSTRRSRLSETSSSKEKDVKIELLPNPKTHRGGHRRLKSAEDQRQVGNREPVKLEERKGSLDSNIGKIQNDAIGVNDLVDRLKVISETNRSCRNSPVVERRFSLDPNGELDRVNSVRNILKPKITVENSTPRSSSPVSINEEDNQSNNSSPERNVSRECSIGSASDLWIDEEVINRRRGNRCRRSVSAASGRSSESVDLFRAKYAKSPTLTSTSSEDDTNRDPDKQSFISGRSIDSGLSDIFETSREETPGLQGPTRPKSHAVAKSDSGVMKDINDIGTSQSDNVFEEADPSECSKELESLCHHCQNGFKEESENTSNDMSLAICKKCDKKKVERKEAIVELIQTEINYGQDLRILKEEFYAPIKNGGILSPENVNGVFLNLQELIDVNSKLCITLQGDLEECITRNDQELESLEVGRVFLENVEFFQAYEVFCSKQGQAADLVENLQKKSELLRIFLQVSCKQNSKLRKMDLKSFLTMPVQRIMKYPLLLTRIYRATPRGNADREALIHARRKIEGQITRINEIAAGRPPKLRKSKSTSALNQSESKGNQLTKLVADILDWRLEETQIVLSDPMEASSTELINVENWNKKSMKKSSKVQVILCAYGVLEHSQALAGKSEDPINLDPRSKCEATSAAVIVLRRKSTNRYSLHKNPILLGKAVVSQRADVKIAFEILPISKEPITFVTDDPFCCQKWLKHLQFYSKDLGLWRARRNAMANIMIQSMS